MKTYKVNVNGTVYEVTVEEMNANEIGSAAPAPAAAPKANGAGETVSVPMPGTILSVNVKAGDKVAKGQVLAILEAMKMENEIMAPADGTVTSVSVTKGASVKTGDVLCTIA